MEEICTRWALQGKGIFPKCLWFKILIADSARARYLYLKTEPELTSFGLS